MAVFTLCLLFCLHARFLALSSLLLPSQFLPFWRRDNETASTASSLRTINLRKFTQTGYFNCIPKQDGCLRTSHTFNCIPEAWQIAFLKPDGSQSHTPPTENMHCKISSLALRRSGTMKYYYILDTFNMMHLPHDTWLPFLDEIAVLMASPGHPNVADEAWYWSRHVLHRLARILMQGH